METLNYIVELKPEEAEIIQGGAFAQYTTKGVSSYLNVRSGPGTNYKPVSRWYANTKLWLQEPPISVKGWRSFGNKNWWVSERYIKPVTNPAHLRGL